MTSDDQIDSNRLATQLAGAAVTHFLSCDEESLKECVARIPDPPGPWVGLLRFAALAIAVIAEDSETDQADVARELVLRVAELE
jgi:hypothetical protein